MAEVASGIKPSQEINIGNSKAVLIDYKLLLPKSAPLHNRLLELTNGNLTQSEDVKFYLSSLEARTAEYFTSEGRASKLNSGKARSRIYKALGDERVLSHINNLTDFYKYGNKFFEVAKSLLNYDTAGKPMDQEFVLEILPKTLDQVIKLTREDFDQDIDSLTQILKENPGPFTMLDRLINLPGLIQHSADISIFGRFIKDLKQADKGEQALHDVFNLLEGYPENDREREWKKVVASSKDLDQLLNNILVVVRSNSVRSVPTMSFSMSPSEINGFYIAAGGLVQKGIPAGFLLSSTESLEKVDLTKDGIDCLTPKLRLGLLNHYGLLFENSPDEVEKAASHVNEALNDETDWMGAPLKLTAADILSRSIGNLLDKKNFESLVKIKKFIDCDQILATFDEERAKSIMAAPIHAKLISYISLLGSSEANSLFSKTMQAAREVIAAKLEVDEDLADYFVENAHGYHKEPWVGEYLQKAMSHFSVADKFTHIEDLKSTNPWEEQPWYKDVLAKAKETVEKATSNENGFWDADEDQDQHEIGYGTQGFSETDPYEKDSYLMDEYGARAATALAHVMSGGADATELEYLQLTPEQHNAVEELNLKVERTYSNFLQQVKTESAIPQQDREALLDPSKLTPLLDNVRVFMARYMLLNSGADFAEDFLNQSIEIGGLEEMLEEGFRRYLKIYAVDIPLYDKLYEELDEARSNGQPPLEVYLGRDGVYAYVGRRAQDLSRLRALGMQGRKQLRGQGSVLEIHPKYLVYPRYFRDSLNTETKRKFLEQEGVSKEANPVFYDTGYTGTIPEQIMRIMGFDNEDIEKRIRLLSAPVAHRRVKGIPENARSEIIEYIEHNAKSENSAEGLIKDEKTGRIRHIARPTTPEEQFYFWMIKQAISRHYWLKEQKKVS